MNKTTNETKNQQIACTHCARTFGPNTAYHVRIGEDVAQYTCPLCEQTAEGPLPEETVERPPPTRGRTFGKEKETGLEIARVYFDTEATAWLQYREDALGWVREEMYLDGEETTSLKAEVCKEDLMSPSAYAKRAERRLTTYTITGLRIKRPHIASALLIFQ